MQVKQTVYSGYVINTVYHDEFLDGKKYKNPPELLYEVVVGEIVYGSDEESINIDMTDIVNSLTRWCKTYEEALAVHEQMSDEVDELIDMQMFPYIRLSERKHYAIYPDEKGIFQIWQIYTQEDEKYDVAPVKLIRVRGTEDDNIDVCLEIVKKLNERERSGHNANL